VEDLTGIDLTKMSKEDVQQTFLKDYIDKSCSPVSILGAPANSSHFLPQRPPSTPIGSNKSKSFDIKQAKDSDDVQSIHEAYQYVLRLKQTTFAKEQAFILSKCKDFELTK
jgi:hypothetical protein